MHGSEIPSPTPVKPKRVLWLGAAFFALSALLWCSLLVLPFLSLDAGPKVGIGIGVGVSAEISFLVGAMLVGATVMARYRRFLNPRRWLQGRGGQTSSPEPKHTIEIKETGASK